MLLLLMRIVMEKFLVVSLFVGGVVSHHSNREPDNGQPMIYEGDVLLGGLFPIHKQSQESHKHCGEIQSEDGIQPLEAMLFTLDEINRNPDILPNIKLGAIGYDSCDDPIYAVEQSVNLFKGFIARKANLSVKNERSQLMVGMVGPQTSAVSVQLANLGRIFRIPQISYLSTSDKLCNTQEFPYFFRTVPNDVHQAKAITKIFDKFDWNYASIVHSDSEYGEMGYQALKRQMINNNKCLSNPIIIINKYFTAEKYQEIIKKLQENKLSRIVVVFCDRLPAGRLLEAAKQAGVLSDFIWIGSDAWASRESVVKGREATVNGAVAFQPLRRLLPGYDDYFDNLKYGKNGRNPWFNEYFRTYHNCTENTCYKLKKRKKQEPQLYIHFVRDAVYAFAHAIHNLQIDKCHNSHEMCQAFKKGLFTDLREYLEKVEFFDVDGHSFKFYGEHELDNFKHDGPPRYSIINFQRRYRPNSGEQYYDWFNVGTYQDGHIYGADPSFISQFSNLTATTCQRRICQVYEIKVPTTRQDSCCWICKECTRFEYRKSEFECADCPSGTQSSLITNRTTCLLIPEIYMDFNNKWAIGAMSFASIGILMTIITSIVFCLYWETPVVKASGRELSCILLLGTFLSFTLTFIIVAKPTNWSCGIMRFGIGFCYTVCYAAVVTKTNRVSRIFQSASNKNPKWTSPLSSVLITAALVFIEIIINAIWLGVEPPATTHIVSQIGKRILVCSGVNDSFMAGLIYPFFLILTATMYAFKTRKCPGGFNETRFIFFANTITLIHWLAYVPLYLASTDHHIRSVILAVSLCLSGIVQLGCLLFPKLYTVLFNPGKNTREAVMTQHRSRNYSMAPTPINNPETPPDVGSSSIAGGGSFVTPNSPQNQTLLLQQKNQQTQSSASTSASKMGLDERHRTWSHTLHASCNDDARPTRMRSTSISRSTQTNIEISTNGGEDLETASTTKQKTIKFIVDHDSSEDELYDDEVNEEEEEDDDDDDDEFCFDSYSSTAV